MSSRICKLPISISNKSYNFFLFLRVQRLCEVLSCYRGGSDITVLGERYGYGYGKKETASKGEISLLLCIFV